MIRKFQSRKRRLLPKNQIPPSLEFLHPRLKSLHSIRNLQEIIEEYPEIEPLDIILEYIELHPEIERNYSKRKKKCSFVACDL